MKYIGRWVGLFFLFAIIGCDNQQEAKPQSEKPQSKKLSGQEEDGPPETPTGMPHTSQFTFDGRQYRVAKTEIVAAIGDPFGATRTTRGRGK